MCLGKGDGLVRQKGLVREMGCAAIRVREGKCLRGTWIGGDGLLEGDGFWGIGWGRGSIGERCIGLEMGWGGRRVWGGRKVGVGKVFGGWRWVGGGG